MSGPPGVDAETDSGCRWQRTSGERLVVWPVWGFVCVTSNAFFLLANIPRCTTPLMAPVAKHLLHCPRLQNIVTNVQDHIICANAPFLCLLVLCFISPNTHFPRWEGGQEEKCLLEVRSTKAELGWRNRRCIDAPTEDLIQMC